MARVSGVRKPHAAAARGAANRLPRRVDPLFEALDGRVVTHGPTEAVVQITGIHRAPDAVFLQVSWASEPDRDFVLRMGLQATAAHALAALEARASLPAEDRPHIVDVMRLAPGI